MPSEEPKRRLVAIAVADVVDYSRMMQADQAGTLARLAIMRRDILDEALQIYGGRIFNTQGDKWAAEFPNSVAALTAVWRVQHRIDQMNQPWPAEDRIQLRIGIHQGQVVEDGTDLLGDGIIVAARLEPLSPVGGLCVSDRILVDTAGQFRRGADLTFVDQGEVVLKNIVRPMRVHFVQYPLPAPPPIVTSLPQARPAAAVPQASPAPAARQRLPPMLLGALAVALVLTGVAAFGLVTGYRPWTPPIPHAAARVAQAGHLMIAVARLQNDDHREHEQLLLDRLANDFEGAETMQLGQAVTVPDADTQQEALRMAKASAAKLCEASGADVLVWGRVETFAGKTAMRLYWTTGEAVAGAKASGVYQDESDTIALPVLFWNDLKQVLGLLVQSRIADITKQLTGQYAAATLKPLIEQVRNLLQSQQGVWSADTDAKVRFAFAQALSDYGDQSGDGDALRDSIEAYKRVLQTWKRDVLPDEWAMAQNGLGIALRRAGEFPAAVSAHRAALEVWTRGASPLNWAAAQTELGNDLEALGEPDSSNANLLAAVQAYTDALQVRSPTEVPLDWAATQAGLANALRNLGEREKGTASLTASVAAYQAALHERTRARVPLAWAATENNLALALNDLGERETGTARYEQAAAAFRAAQQEMTRDRLPLKWAAVEQNLGNALQMIGNRSTGTGDLSQAVAAYKDALVEITRQRDAEVWAQLQNNLGAALAALGARTGDVDMLHQAVAAQNAAMQVFTRASDPLNWGQAQSDLGNALRHLGEHDTSTLYLAQAEQAYKAAEQELTRDVDPLDWANVQSGLGKTYQLLAERQNNPQLLQLALECQKNAVDGYQQGDAEAALVPAQNDVQTTQRALAALHH